MQAYGLRWLPTAATVMLLAGCSSSTPVTNPTASTTDLSPSPAPVPSALSADMPYSFVPGGESIVGAYDLSIDVDSLTGTLTPVPARAGTAQPPQAINYDLDIENFLSPSCPATGAALELDGPFSFDANGNLNVGFTHRHPFCAPDFSAAISAANRADLGYTGRLVILAEANADSFFGGDVTTDASTIVAPDGFVDFGDNTDLLVTTGLTNDTYPYVLLADDAADPDGNYGAGGPNGGWQRATALPWVGKDYVHHGSEHQNSFTISAAALALGNFEVRVAVVIKYVDPRGVTGRTMRFPPTTASATDFAYRLPYSNIDASVVDVLTDPIEILAGVGETATVDAQVRDQDAAATEDADANVADVADVSVVELGASGLPAMDIDAPDLSATLVVATPGAGTGVPGDEIQYNALLTNDLDPAVGDYMALARVTDPSAATDDSAYHFAVDGASVPPPLLAGAEIAPITYQAIPYTVMVPPAPDIIDTSPDSGCRTTQATFTYTNVGSTADNWSWNFGGGATPNTSTLENPTVTLATAPGVYNGTLTACAGANCDAPFAFTLTVGQLFNPHHTTTSVANCMWTPRTAIYDGRPAYVAIESSPVGAVTQEHVVFGIGTANPAATADWAVHRVRTWAGGLSSSNADIFVNGGRLYLSYRDHTLGAAAGRLEMSRANVTAPTVPAVAADWANHTIDNGSPNAGRDGSLIMHNGVFYISHWRQTLNQMWLARSGDNDPTATAEWTNTAANVTAGRGLWSEMISFDDGVSPRLVAVETNSSTFQPFLNRATVLTPAGPADWTSHQIGPADGDFHGLNPDLCAVTIAGAPRFAISWGSFVTPRIFVAIAQNTTPASFANYTSIVVDSGFASPQHRGSDIEMVGGRLAVFFYRGGPLGYARAMTNNPLLTADFAAFQANATANSGFWPHQGQLANGNTWAVARLGTNSTAVAAPIAYLSSICPI